MFIPGNGAHVVKITESPPQTVQSILADRKIKKVFHYALFDLRFMIGRWNCPVENVTCTKVASKILDPNCKDHTLKSLLQRHLHVEISKDARLSNWMSPLLTEAQLKYAVQDVVHLPLLLSELRTKLEAKGLWPLAVGCFRFLPFELQLQLRELRDVFEY